MRLVSSINALQLIHNKSRAEIVLMLLDHYESDHYESDHIDTYPER